MRSLPKSPSLKVVQQRQGFGMVLAARSVAGQHGGEIRHTWAREGLTVDLALSVEKLAR